MKTPRHLLFGLPFAGFIIAVGYWVYYFFLFFNVPPDVSAPPSLEYLHRGFQIIWIFTAAAAVAAFIFGVANAPTIDRWLQRQSSRSKIWTRIVLSFMLIAGVWLCARAIEMTHLRK